MQDKDILTRRQSPRLANDAQVEDENGERNGSEYHHFRYPGVHRPEGPGSGNDLFTHVAFLFLGDVAVEVCLDGVDQEGEGDDGGDGGDGPSGGAEPLPLEGMTDGDVALDGESEHEEGTEVLRGQEYDRKDLAQTGHVQKIDAPLELQLKENLDETQTTDRDWVTELCDISYEAHTQQAARLICWDPM